MNTDSLWRCAVATVATALGLWSAGCSGPSAPEPEKPKDVELESIDEAAFAEVLEAHRGKVVLVDYWATWCRDCVELFPHTVALHQRFADRGLVVISVSFDDPKEDRAAALRFLAEKGATFQNFISPYGAGTRSVEAFALDGPLPQMELYDRQGRLHRSFGGEAGTVDRKQLDEAIAQLLGETPPGG